MNVNIIFRVEANDVASQQLYRSRVPRMIESAAAELLTHLIRLSSTVQTKEKYQIINEANCKTVKKTKVKEI